MVSRVLIATLLVSAVPVWGGEPGLFCLSCHPVHYVERGTCSDCHRGNPASKRKHIAHAGLRAGRYVRFTLGDSAQIRAAERLMDQLACRRCHVSAGRGNTLATSLDGAALRRTAVELALSIESPVANMPNFGLNEEQVTTLVNTILAGSQGQKTDQAAPVRIHFNTSVKKNTDIFSTKCGSCHRVLSKRLGAVGTGDISPNLSGLYSEHYTKTFKNGEAWTAANLRVWLKNPRDTRPGARMQPVTLTGAEMQELESIIAVSKESTK